MGGIYYKKIWLNFNDLDDEIFNMDETLDHMDGIYGIG
jgi:hypothetical protein